MLGEIAAEQQLIAFMRDTEDPEMLSRNRIHTGSGAREFGFDGALVGGVTVYGWCIPVILEAAGAPWLSDGWIDIRFRRPIYPEDRITIRALEAEDDTFTLEVLKDLDELCIVGTFGRGHGPWLKILSTLPPRTPDPPPKAKEQLRAEGAPLGQDLRTLGLDFSPELITKIAREDLRSTDPRFTDPSSALVPPSLMARQMISLLAHTFEYGKPSIHVRSRVQHLAPASAAAGYTLSGRLINAWERGGHQYAESDGNLYSPAGVEVARIRHTNIIRVRGHEAEDGTASTGGER